MSQLISIATSELKDRALAWAVAVVMGRALRAPRYASIEATKHLKLPFTLYDVDVTVAEDDEDKITQASPVEITVVECNSGNDPLIVYRDQDGQEVTSWLRFYFVDKHEAEIRAAECLYGPWSKYDPANDWTECGRIIDARGILFQAAEGGAVMAYLRNKGTSGPKGFACDHRTAALRCLVAAECGPTVDVPADLVN